MTWHEGLITFLQVAAILSGAAFASLALFTEYKKDGKVTKYGRFAVLGIVLSALFSLGTQWGQAKLDSEMSRKAGEAARIEQDRQNARFYTQLSQFRGLYGQMDEVNQRNRQLLDNMRRSLATQNMLLTSARSNILLTASLGAQERQNTGRVLRGLWDEANRITGGRIELEIEFRCIANNIWSVPILFPPGAFAQIGIASNASVTAQGVAANLFDTRLVMEPETSLVSAYQRFTVPRSGHVGQWSQITRFSAFSSPDTGLQRFADPEYWQDVAIDVVVTALQPQDARDLWNLPWAIEFARGMRGAEMRDFYQLPPRMRVEGFEVLATPCLARMTLMVNERTVAINEAIVAHVHESPDDERGLFVAKFPIIRTVPDALPRYAGMAGMLPGPDTSRR